MPHIWPHRPWLRPITALWVHQPRPQYVRWPRVPLRVHYHCSHRPRYHRQPRLQPVLEARELCVHRGWPQKRPSVKTTMKAIIRLCRRLTIRTLNCANRASTASRAFFRSVTSDFELLSIWPLRPASDASGRWSIKKMVLTAHHRHLCRQRQRQRRRWARYRRPTPSWASSTNNHNILEQLYSDEYTTNTSMKTKSIIRGTDDYRHSAPRIKKHDF